MAFVRPQHSRKQVDRAGDCLREEPFNVLNYLNALPVITNWRAAHAYPLNTFQATLRHRLKTLGLDATTAPVGQRLKRLPSIESKLKRFDQMSLARMQDIAGLRAVVPSISSLKSIRQSYENSTRFAHELRTTHDYVNDPKDDGYRSIHLIYRYQNLLAPEYNGLHVELQLRTRLQHAWATAVETVDTFANQAIKAGRPTPQWRDFFLLASAAFANIEKQPLPSALRTLSQGEIIERLHKIENELNVIVRLRGFSVAADKIQRSGRSKSAYHLVILDTERHVLNITSYSAKDLDEATDAYAEAEKRTAAGEPIDAVLIAGGGVEQLRKTYPNYFLDSTDFVRRISSMCNLVDNSTGKLKKP